MRLALLLEFGQTGFSFPQGGHRVSDGCEDRAGLGVLLDHVRPPALAILVARSLRQRADRVADIAGLIRCLVGQMFGLRLLLWREIHRCVVLGLVRVVLAFGSVRQHGNLMPLGRGQIDEAHRCAILHRPERGLIFRRELGKRPEAGRTGIVLRIAEQRDRRLHLGRCEHRQQRRGIRRTFDQNRDRLQLIKSFDQAVGRARSVMADAED